MTENFIAHELSASELTSKLKSFGIEVQEKQLNHFLNILSLTSEGAEVNCETKFPHFPPGVFGMMVPNTSYYVRTKRASLLLAATLLDAAVTSGLASASLAMTGMATESFVKVSQKNGEYCILTHVYDRRRESGKSIKPKKIHEVLYEKTCPYNKAGCQFTVGTNCGAKIKDVKNIYKKLAEKELLLRESGKWKLVNKL